MSRSPQLPIVDCRMGSEERRATGGIAKRESGRYGRGMLGTRVTIGIAIATGVALELGIHALSGRQEAWDSSLYWIAGLPIAGAVAVVQGALARRRDWLWAFAIVPSQITTMMVRSGEISILWPLTVAAGVVLSAPVWPSSDRNCGACLGIDFTADC